MSVHANVAVPARDRRRLERLCRYGARPPVATERLSRLEDGGLLYRLKHRWRDGTTHVVFTPHELVDPSLHGDPVSAASASPPDLASIERLEPMRERDLPASPSYGPPYAEDVDEAEPGAAPERLEAAGSCQRKLPRLW